MSHSHRTITTEASSSHRMSYVPRTRLCAWIALVGLALFASAAVPAESQPNIVILLADDLGYGEFTDLAEPRIPTPHIDALARNGVRFTQAYVTAPNCSPSRAGLLTGRIPTRFGYEFNPIGARNEDPGTGLPPSELTLAECLHDVGYTTGLIGKWHLGGAADYHPHRHGFDEFYGFMHEGHYYVPPPWSGTTTMLRRKALPGNGRGRWEGDSLVYTTHMGHDEPDYDANNPIIRGGQPVVEPSYLTEAFTRESLGFIERHQDKPFFLLVAYNAVHSPLQAADRWMKKFEDIKDIHRRIFAAMLAHLDESVGAILHQLSRLDLEERTLVLFLSDNGGPTRELTSSNLPFRGGKGQMYEGGLRVPFLARWPKRLPADHTYDQPVFSVDIFATAARLAGASLPPDLDGIDLMPFLEGAQPDPPHREFFWRQGARTALRDGDWKLLNMNSSVSQPKWELYQLSQDPTESSNLAESHPDRVAAMIESWERWNRQMKSPLF